MTPSDQVDREVDDHPGQDDRRQPEARGLRDDVRPGQRRDRVADERDEPDDRVEADPAPGPGDLDEVVEDVAHRRDAALGGPESLGPAGADDLRFLHGQAAPPMTSLVDKFWQVQRT